MGEEGTARGRSQPHSTKTFRKITNFPWKRGNPSFIINTGLEESCRLFRGNNVSSRGWLTGLSPFFNRGSPPISIIFSTHHYGRKSQGKSGFTSIRSVHFYESHPSPILLLVVRFCFNTRFFCKICLYLVIQFLPSEPLLRFSRGKSSRLFISDCVPLVNGINSYFSFSMKFYFQFISGGAGDQTEKSCCSRSIRIFVYCAFTSSPSFLQDFKFNSYPPREKERNFFLNYFLLRVARSAINTVKCFMKQEIVRIITKLKG